MTQERRGHQLSNRPRLLVSVRSVPEADAALAGGAALIDVKEPRRGSLGRADEATVQAVVRRVGGRCPVSAALGEWLENRDALFIRGVSYFKWGLAGCSDQPDWPVSLAGALNRPAPEQPPGRAVAVAYADWPRARSPQPEAVWAFARRHRCGALLLDTWGKDGSTLLDWLPLAEVFRICRLCRHAGLPVALAGSLGPAEIAALRPARPDWFAVRGAVCRGGREGTVEAAAVGRLVALLGAG